MTQVLEELGDLYERAPFGYVSTDASGRVLRVNGTLLSWAGLDRGAVLGTDLRDLLTPGSRTWFDTHYLPLLHVRGEVREVALDLRGADGDRLPVLASSTVVRDDASAVVVRTSFVQAAERRSYERELLRARFAAETSERRLRILHDAVTAFAQAPDLAAVAAAVAVAVDSIAPTVGVAVWLVDPDTQEIRRHCVLGADDLAPSLLDPAGGLPAEEACRAHEPVTVFDVTTTGRPAGVVRSLVAAPVRLEGRLVGVYQATYGRMRSFPADDLETHARLVHQAGIAVHRARLHAQLRRAALHDPLTGTANRASFDEAVLAALAAAAAGRPLAVLLLDLDDFKAVNDTLGHSAGDDLLVELARRLEGSLGEGHLLARLGGDEFAVLAPEVDERAASALAEGLLAATSRPFRLAATPVQVTASVGASVHRPGPGTSTPTPDELRHLADVALYRAKAQGKNQHRVHDAELRAELARREWVGAELRHALEHGDLVPYFQPVVDLRTGRLVGAESLCRLRAAGELLLPADFLEIATEEGVLHLLDRQMLRHACEELVAWDGLGRGDLEVSVNVAAQHVARVDFADGVLEVVEAVGCDPARLHLELTESALLELSPGTTDRLRRLRELGIGVMLDDFGTRYASLSYARQFPVTALKIDRSFVAGLPTTRTDAAIVRSVAALAEGLGVKCVAEGVETPEQREFLAALGLLGQGFGLARPMPADELRARLQD